MVHNGIEYAIMQALAETYDIMKRGLSMRPEEMAEVFGEWNQGGLSGYLLEITEKILRYTDPETGGHSRADDEHRPRICGRLPHRSPSGKLNPGPA